MEFMRKVNKRLIAFILVFTIVFTLCGNVSPVSAREYIGSNGIISNDGDTDDITKDVSDFIDKQEESTKDAIADSKSKKATAGDWKKAIYEDGLAWNTFHNVVQFDIRMQNTGKVDGEKLITLYNEKKEPTGKSGRADIVYHENNSDDYYVYEVKPYSYSVDPKKALGEAQLEKYVRSYNTIHGGEHYHKGGKVIKNGETQLAPIDKGDYVIIYTVTYEVQENGLILYRFDRSEMEKKPEEAAETVAANGREKAKKKVEKAEKVTNSNSPDSGDIAAINPLYVAAIITLASGIYSISAKQNANPDTQTSVSQTAMLESGKTVSNLSYYFNEINKSAAIIGIIGAGTILVPADDVNAQGINDTIYDFKTLLEVLDLDVLEDIDRLMEEENVEEINKIIAEIQKENDEYEKATKAQPPRDPLVIDFGKDGIDLCTLKDGVNFDLDNNGFAEKTAWIGNEDGFLAYDRNANGKIDNGGELFGDRVILSNGNISTSGFEALTDLDDNNDKIIDENDNCFNELIVWIDYNHNGISENNELKSLKESGVVSIDLEYNNSSILNEDTGTLLELYADVELNDEGNTKISEFWFPVNTTDTTHGSIKTSGNVKSISQALEEDESGELASYIKKFDEADSIAYKKYYVKKILYYMTDATDIKVNSRGGNIDARDLKVIEEFMGRDFDGVGGTSPNINAANILKLIYNRIENYYYNILSIRGENGKSSLYIFEYLDENNKKILDMTLPELIINNSSRNEEICSYVYGLTSYLGVYDEINDASKLKEWKDICANNDFSYNNIIEMVNSSMVYIGTGSADNYSGSDSYDFIFGENGNDVLIGNGGDDCIYGGIGNDIIDGGMGNDHLYGDENEENPGDDTYVFKKGYGHDEINDLGGKSTIRLENISYKDIRVNGKGANDAEIKLKDNDDTLIIKDFSKNNNYLNYEFVFKEGTMHCTDENSPFKFLYGGSENDELKAVIDDTHIYGDDGSDIITGSNGTDVIYGNSGDDLVEALDCADYIFGGDGDDLLLAGDGDDFVFADEGNDLIDGDNGNDYLFGGAGNDTYLFGKGYGIDIINDNDGENIIQLNDSVEESEIIVAVAGEDLILYLNNKNDILIISEYSKNENNYVFELDGKNININDYINDALTNDNNFKNDLCIIGGTEQSDALFSDNKIDMIFSGEQYDYIVGGSDIDYIFSDSDPDRVLSGDGKDIVYGLNGNDQLLAEAGNDIVFGGRGEDYLNGGSGNDIIIPGEGDDFIDGGLGDDKYFISFNGGMNTVKDSDGDNIIFLSDGISSKNAKVKRSDWNDLRITFDGAGTEIIIKNYCVDENARNFRFIFADGTIESKNIIGGMLRTISDSTETEYHESIYDDGETIVASDGDDYINGSEKNDVLLGGKGCNRIIGNAGNDKIDGGKGCDYMNGGQGDDYYVYLKGYGTDTISDSEGNNTISISGYAADSIKAYRTNWNNLTITFNNKDESLSNDEDKIIIENFFTSINNRKYRIICDGYSFDATDLNSPFRTLYGTGASDYLLGFDDERITIYGLDADDTLTGSNSDDLLYGGKGNDRIIGGKGDDIIAGEEGNDYLEGGQGNDRYIFNAGGGNDEVNDNQGVNEIVFGPGLNKEEMILKRSNWNNLSIGFEGISDKLIIINYFVSDDYKKYNVIFGNKNSYEYDDPNNPFLAIK